MTTLFRRRRNAIRSLMCWLAVANIRLRNRWSFSGQLREDVHNAMVTVLLLTGLLIAYGIVGAMDYEDALITEAQVHAASKDRYRLVVQSCLNGGAFYYPDTREAFECSAKPMGMQ